MAEEFSRTIDHLTKIPRPYRWARRLDRTPVLGWILRSIGAIWLSALVAVGIAYVLDHHIALAILWLIIGALASVEIAAALVAHGAKRYQACAADLGRVMALNEFLDCKYWNHPESHRVLRVRLRPSAFPSRSKTELAIAGNEGRIEGIADACYCAGEEQRVAPCRSRWPICPSRPSCSIGRTEREGRCWSCSWTSYTNGTRTCKA